MTLIKFKKRENAIPSQSVILNTHKGLAHSGPRILKRSGGGAASFQTVPLLLALCYELIQPKSKDRMLRESYLRGTRLKDH